MDKLQNKCFKGSHCPRRGEKCHEQTAANGANVRFPNFAVHAWICLDCDCRVPGRVYICIYELVYIYLYTARAQHRTFALWPCQPRVTACISTNPGYIANLDMMGEAGCQPGTSAPVKNSLSCAPCADGKFQTQARRLLPRRPILLATRSSLLPELTGAVRTATANPCTKRRKQSLWVAQVSYQYSQLSS